MTVAGAVAVARLLRGAHRGRRVPGGILIGHSGTYDALSHRLLLGSLHERIAQDIAAAVPEGARVLDLGCGPGRLSIRLARDPRLDVTGLDLDPAMIARARANAAREGAGARPSFLVADAASMAFPDGSFDLVVSTLSMHHWADPAAGLSEIGRVLRPGGRALIWELRPGGLPLHRDVPDPALYTTESKLRLLQARPWRWPWRFTLTQRIELANADDLTEHLTSADSHGHRG